MASLDTAKNAGKLDDQQLRLRINQKLMESGEKESLKEMLRAKLVESGWKDNLKAHCKDVIKNKQTSSITVEELVAEITPFARANVPEPVKAELLQRIKKFIAENFDS